MQQFYDLFIQTEYLDMFTEISLRIDLQSNYNRISCYLINISINIVFPIHVYIYIYVRGSSPI